MEPSANLDTFLIGGAFIAIVLIIATTRNRETARLQSLLQDKEVILSTLGVYYHGRESEPGRPLRSLGALALTTEGLYFRSRLFKREIFIPGSRLTSLSVVSEFKGKNMYENIVAVNFIGDDGKRDRVGFKIPFPERWSAAINAHFLTDR